jgi:hypothetical protein
LIDDFEVFDPLFENLTIVVMPLSVFDIKEIVVEILDVLQVLLEDALEFLKVLGNFWTLSSSENGHANLGALSCELKLTLTDFFEVLAPLDESLILSENCFIVIKRPTLSGGVLLDKTLHL